MRRKLLTWSWLVAVTGASFLGLPAGVVQAEQAVPLEERSTSEKQDTPKTTAASPPAVPKFAADIEPLLKAKCWRCHGPTVTKADLALHTREGILKGSESGPIVVAGKSADSRLFEVVHEGEMPPDQQDPLTAGQVELIRRWIDGGADFGGAPAAANARLTQHDVIPVLLLRCTACHGRQKQEGGLDLRTAEGLQKGGKSGPAIVPGQPAQSLILKRIHAEEMPPRPRLTEVSVKPMEPVEIDKLTNWIAQGALEVADEPDLAGTMADPLVRAEDRQFWAFQKPQPIVPPAVKSVDRVRNPIDAFLLQKLEERGLSLAPEADRVTLARRATFDLTGLPPDPEELARFLSDTSSDAYERLIDRLLASSRYGERWGRHWLDVAGYADCEGRREQHLPRPFAWRYRDYVIRSINADKPYDRFLLEQLAGDELANYTEAAEITQELEDNLVATAFLRMSPDPTWANLTGYVPDRLEVMADVMDILGSGVMGLTFKCARCHTHKFDPIPQRDYYRLVALFKGAYDEHDWLKPELNGFGGALSAGSGDRNLTYVTTAERQRWLQLQSDIQKSIETLKSGPQTAETPQLIQAQEGRRQPEPRLMALWDRGEPSPTYIYRRGDYQNSGPLVQPGVPAVLSDPQQPLNIVPPWQGAKSTGRRLAFARWLTRPDHPLTSRVMINRVWKHHFGQGIVRSVGNFGKTGDRPSHPELLDWLAQEFIRAGWSLKAMHRLLMTSSAYRQSSLVAPEMLAADPDNRWWSRRPLQRMEAEVLRDSLLLVSGQLIEQAGGPAERVQVRPDGLVVAGRRRSIYVQQLRKEPVSLLESFDLPAMNPNCLSRAESLVAPQALHLLNDTGLRQQAAQLAARVQREVGADLSQQIERVYWLTLSRAPQAEELAESRQILEQLILEWNKHLTAAGQSAAGAAERQALATYCHTIFNSAAFLYID